MLGALIVPEVPVTVMVVLCPVPADDDGVRVSVVDPPLLTVVGLNDPLTPPGSPDTVNVTFPENPFAPLTVILSVADVPPEQKIQKQLGGVTVRLVDASEILKDAAPDTLKLCVTGLAAA